jgi:hypothetical protein
MDSRHQSFNDTILVVDDLHSQIPFDNKGRGVTFARGARQLVVQEALEMTSYSGL